WAVKIPEAAESPLGYFEARPGDIAGQPEAFLIVDVRTEEELLGEYGHIHGARHVPMDRLLAEGLPEASADSAVVLVCRSGRRSATCAAELRRRHGIHEV